MVFSALSIKFFVERTFIEIKKKYLPHVMIMLSSDATLYLYSSLDSQPVETKYDLEVEVSSIARKQEDTSDHDEPDAGFSFSAGDLRWLWTAQSLAT